MNKKIFTLLASSLMLFMAVFSTNAQQRDDWRWVGDTVEYLPQGIGKGAYHLVVTGVGQDRWGTDSYPAFADTMYVLALDSFGYVGLMDSAALHANYSNLRSAMWCVDVEQESLGVVPTYTFTNKEYTTELAVMNAAFDTSTIYTTSAFNNLPIREQVFANRTGSYKDDKVFNTGDFTQWWFSRTYNTSFVERNQYLRVEIDNEPDYFLTFAYKPGEGLALVKAHQRDFEPGALLYENYLVRFTLMSAAPRVLNAMDFNTKLYELDSPDYVQMIFDPGVTPNQRNVFAQPLKAKDVIGLQPGAVTPKDHYLQLRNTEDNVVYASRDYYNSLGNRYPILKDDVAEVAASAEDEFRLVYYPSEDSLIINVRELQERYNAPPVNVSDPGHTTYSMNNGLYNWEILNYLIVRMQNLDLAQTDRVITVADEPASTRAYFDIKNCESYNPNRTTIEPDLYTVQDAQGRYLIVPLVNGDFTPTWRRLHTDRNNDTLEVALKTPAYQWFVTKVQENSETSRIFLTNREFNNIRLEYVQIYKTPTVFYATWRFYDNVTQGEYNIVNGTALVSADGFKKVQDDPAAATLKNQLIGQYGRTVTGPANHQVEAWMNHMPQDMLQKLYRTSPFLGYKAILPDTLSYYGYAFNYLHAYSDDYYMGVTERNNSGGDTMLYVSQERTFFELDLPDTLRAYGREKYGLGHSDSIYLRYPQTRDIAPLERYFYHFKINDYYKFSWNDDYLVLDDDARYVYTDEANANARRLNKAKFYMRFTFDKNNTEYYTFLDRIDKSNFDYLTNTVGLAITDTLKAEDNSHGGITENSFGVIMAAVDQADLFVLGKPKTVGSEVVSTFALAQMQDELYRRFNTGLEECGRGEEGDEPRTLKFYRYNNPVEFVFEDAHSRYSVPNSGINFMGIENAAECTTENGHWHAQHNYAIYVDTAYVNRGTGIIKPQYMLVMNPRVERGGVGCNECGDSIDFRPYVYGRYLRNMTDSARVGGAPNGRILNENYIYDGKWERLAFVEAIHAGDSLYILNGTPIESLYARDADGNQYLNFALMSRYTNIRIVNLANNLHKDEVFSMRFVERQRDMTGTPISGASKRFLMESETTNRDVTQGRMIAPISGGWVKRQNFVPVISRGSFQDAIMEAEVWEVSCAAVNELPTSNEDVTTSNVTVVSNNGSISILNAAGKRAVVSNVLGQMIANEVLSSDNETIQAPTGVIIVAIEGNETIKTIVK